MVHPLLIILLFLACFILLLVVFLYTMKRLLGISGKFNDLFKPHNDIHKYIDKTIVVSASALPLVGFLFNPSWLSKLFNVSFALIILSLVISAIIEFRYAKERNVYKLIMSWIIFLIVFYIALLYAIHKTDFLDFFR